MKKLVLVVAMFMFVCGGSFLVKAQSSAEAVTAPTGINATVVNDTVEELITIVGGFLKDFRLAESMSYRELLGTYQRIKSYVKG